ncbi:MAG: outer membrane channel protein TolC [Henriciella sp.]
MAYFNRTGIFLIMSLMLSWVSKGEAQSLQDAINAAWQNNPAMVRSQSGIDRAGAALGQAKANYRPTLSFDSSISASSREASLQDGNNFSETSEPLSATLRLNQTLYASGLRTIQSKNARYGLDASNHQKVSDQRALALNVAQSLSDLILSDFSLKIAIDRAKRNNALIDAERERLRLGTGTETNVYLVEARAADAEAAMAGARSELAATRRAFELVTGLTVEQPYWGNLDLLVVETLEEAVSLALKQSPDIKAAQANFEISALNVKASKRRYGPQVALALEASTSRESSPAIDQDDDLRATMTFSLPLYSGNRSSYDKREALADQTIAWANIRALTDDTEQRVTETWYRRVAAKEQLRAAEAGLNAAAQALEGVRRGRDAGLWSLTDVLDASEQLAEAEQRQSEAVIALDLAGFELALLVGSLDIASNTHMLTEIQAEDRAAALREPEQSAPQSLRPSKPTGGSRR